MKEYLKNMVRKSPLKPLIRYYHELQSWIYEVYWTRKLRQLLVPKTAGHKVRIYYLGITEHSNLGDLAQYYCIGLWLRKNYPEAEIIELPSRVVVEPQYHFVFRLQKVIQSQDLIFFQSGYTTQDLGGNHDLMHRIIIENFSNNKIVFMPQTVFFQSPDSRKESSQIYNLGKRTLFLARDRISYETALEMFPSLIVRLFPDVVTSLIEQGQQVFTLPANKIMICCRNDSEKFYSSEQILHLQQELNLIAPTAICDTTASVSVQKIKKQLGKWIWETIGEMAKCQVVITDRYHGTIFSVIAGTPVIVLKTVDHKVVTGTEWFDGHCNGLVHLAENLEEIPALVQKISKVERSSLPDRYFSDQFYNQLKSIIDCDLK